MQWFSDLLTILISMFIMRSCTALTPTPKNMQTSSIQAIDINRNGVWDDVEQKIEEKWRNEHPDMRKAAFEGAIALQNSLDPSVDIEKRDKAMTEALACMLATERAQHPDEDEWKRNRSLELRDMVISNPARQKLYIKYNAALSGKMIPIPSSSLFYCKYNNHK
ncbi:hypothetical protein [Pseudobdellovibrio sp. HCB154]|uniref:hypothetical protein n=1 Tax=Pseudobdellovibrio sp. HCB154 TaxID=3386277 RepID=UPI003916D29D